VATVVERRVDDGEVTATKAVTARNREEMEVMAN